MEFIKQWIKMLRASAPAKKNSLAKISDSKNLLQGLADTFSYGTGEKNKAAGLIFDSSSHYLDHLAPFCAELNLPLLFCDPILKELADRFYPSLQTKLFSWVELRNDLHELRYLVTCAPRPLLNASLGPISCTTLWLPHGNSDKGQITSYFKALQEEQILLVYGHKMAAFFQAGGVSAHFIHIGCYRFNYYQKNRAFYDALPIGSFSRPQFTVLYAPTWEDSEQNCSFWEAFPRLSARLPSSINLLVKLHPNTIAQHAPLIERLMGENERENLQFLIDFPPIFPIFQRCDAYLGDRSSIGYDFLMMDRPMFFLDPHNHPEGRDLLQCGLSVTPENFYDCLMSEPADRLSASRQAMVMETFCN